MEYEGDETRIREYVAKQKSGVIFDVTITIAGAHIVPLAYGWFASENLEDLEWLFTKVHSLPCLFL